MTGLWTTLSIGYKVEVPDDPEAMAEYEHVIDRASAAARDAFWRVLRQQGARFEFEKAD